MRLTGNTMLITGGTSGIGRALAEAFYARGNEIIIAGRRQTLIDEVTALHPGMHGIPLDIADPRAIDTVAGDVKRRFPGLNVLINNAGTSKREDLTGDAIDVGVPGPIIQTNIVGTLRLTGALLPVLKQQPAATVMVTTSGLGFVPRAEFPTYSATKAFLYSWLQSLRFQLRRTPVEVLELMPPYVQTELGGPDQAKADSVEARLRGAVDHFGRPEFEHRERRQ